MRRGDRRLRRACLIPAAILLAGCGAPAAGPSPAAPGGAPPAAGAPLGATLATASTVAQSASFGQWLAAFRIEAIAAGISPATFDAAFAGVAPDPRVLDLDQSQPEFTRRIWEYLDSAVSPTRVSMGRQRLDEHRALLDRIGAAYGVDPRVIVAIWGLESGYGNNVGSYDVIQSLVTLAYEGRRQAAFRAFLLQALRILERGDIARDRMVGSWAGAMGQTQFMPGSYLSYAVDQDGDGRRDLWRSLADVFGSTANYLAGHGWVAGETWGAEVALPAGFDYRLTGADTRRSLAEWQQLGVTGVRGSPPPTRGAAALIVPAGHRGPAFLVYDNFRVILRYNNATSYALAIGLLADRIAGQGGVVGSWPVGDRPLSRSDREDLQRLLTARGYDTQGIDGIIGPNTRDALRRFQEDIGVPADGYPTVDLLDRLRS